MLGGTESFLTIVCLPYRGSLLFKTTAFPKAYDSAMAAFLKYPVCAQFTQSKFTVSLGKGSSNVTVHLLKNMLAMLH